MGIFVNKLVLLFAVQSRHAPYIATNPTYQYADFCEAYPPFERGRADAE